jgi:hypothetical protein
MIFGSGDKNHGVYIVFSTAPDKNTGMYAVFGTLQSDFPMQKVAKTQCFGSTFGVCDEVERGGLGEEEVG